MPVLDDRAIESDVPVELIGEGDKNLIAKLPDEKSEVIGISMRRTRKKNAVSEG